MIRISILLLISVSMNCEDLCPHIQQNGTNKGLGIYHRFRSTDEKDADFVMFNGAGYEWRFGLSYNEKDKYQIHMLNDTVKPTTGEGVAYRFGLYFIEGWMPKTYAYIDCSVRDKVKNILIFDFQKL